MIDLGMVKPGSTINVPFGTYDGGTGASLAATAFDSTDIEIYKDGDATQRGSDAGFTATTSFDSATLTGINRVQIDLSDDTTGQFYEMGSEYFVAVGPITVDAQTVYFPLCRFIIGYYGAVLNTTITTVSSQTSFILEDGAPNGFTDAYEGCTVLIHDRSAADEFAIAQGTCVAYTSAAGTKTLTLQVDPGVFTAVNGDDIAIFPRSGVLDTDMTKHSEAGSVGFGIIQAAYMGSRGPGIFFDPNAANTNTNLGEDGTPRAPVSTIAAAATLVSNLGHLRVYVVDGTLTLGADNYNDWEFVGVSGYNSALLDLGTATSTTGTSFYGLEVSGTVPGTTGLIHLYECKINGILAFKGSAFQCAIAGTNNELDASIDSFWHQCYSAIAGTSTPSIDFTTAASANLNVRDYSGGLEIKNLASTNNVSFEARGQIVFNSNCTGGTVALRGNMDVTDNTATKPITITKTAVINQSQMGVLASGFAQASAAGTLVLKAASAFADDELNGAVASIVGGVGAGQNRIITDYDNATDTATISPNWATTPTATSEYVIFAGAANTVTVGGTVQTALDLNDIKDETALIVADTNELQTDDVPSLIAALDAVVDTVKAETALIVADTNELQTDDVPGLIAALDAVVDTVKAETALIVADTNELQTDDVPGLIAALDAVVDTVKAETALIVGDTVDIQSRLPDALVAGNIKSDVLAINGDTGAAAFLEAIMQGGLIGQVNDAAATTTAFAADGFTETTDDHFKGRLITFHSANTLRYQQTDITGYDAAGGTQGNQEFTVTALTEAPADDDFFVIH